MSAFYEWWKGTLSAQWNGKSRLLVSGRRGAFASTGVAPDVVLDAELIEVAPGLVIRVARAGHLLAMKLRSRDDVRRSPRDRRSDRMWRTVRHSGIVGA